MRRFDHYCPIVDNAVGEGNQGYFLLVLASMLTGQALFLRLGWAYLDRVAPVPKEGVSIVQSIWTGWMGTDPQVAFMWFFQCLGARVIQSLRSRRLTCVHCVGSHMNCTHMRRAAAVG